MQQFREAKHLLDADPRIVARQAIWDAFFSYTTLENNSDEFSSVRDAIWDALTEGRTYEYRRTYGGEDLWRIVV